MTTPLTATSPLTPVHSSEVASHAPSAGQTMPGRSQPTQASQGELTNKAVARDGRMRQKLMENLPDAAKISKYAGYGAMTAGALGSAALLTGAAETATVALAPIGIPSVTIGAALETAGVVLAGVSALASKVDQHVAGNTGKQDTAVAST